MRALSGAEVLNVWERGLRLHPLDRSLLVLSAVLATPVEPLADWRLGRRNRSLCEFHCLCFGSQLQGWTSCPSCGEKVEFEMDARALMAQSGEHSNPDETVVVRGGQFRLPTSRDLAQIVAAGDEETAARRLAERCRLSEAESPVWLDVALEEIGDCMASADPMADIRLALHCPTCGHGWEDTLDIAAFVWAEIQSHARQLVWEIHTFASAYGWTESEVLALSAARRALYLEMVQA